MALRFNKSETSRVVKFAEGRKPEVIRCYGEWFVGPFKSGAEARDAMGDPLAYPGKAVNGKEYAGPFRCKDEAIEAFADDFQAGSGTAAKLYPELGLHCLAWVDASRTVKRYFPDEAKAKEYAKERGFKVSKDTDFEVKGKDVPPPKELKVEKNAEEGEVMKDNPFEKKDKDKEPKDLGKDDKPKDDDKGDKKEEKDDKEPKDKKKEDKKDDKKDKDDKPKEKKGGDIDAHDLAFGAIMEMNTAESPDEAIKRAEDNLKEDPKHYEEDKKKDKAEGKVDKPPKDDMPKDDMPIEDGPGPADDKIPPADDSPPIAMQDQTIFDAVGKPGVPPMMKGNGLQFAEKHSKVYILDEVGDHEGPFKNKREALAWVQGAVAKEAPTQAPVQTAAQKFAEERIAAARRKLAKQGAK